MIAYSEFRKKYKNTNKEVKETYSIKEVERFAYDNEIRCDGWDDIKEIADDMIELNIIPEAK